MHLPEPRGDLSEQVFDALRQDRSVPQDLAPTDNEDLHVTLWSLYELHYRGFADVDPGREWDPALLAVRAGLEAPFELSLRERTADLLDDVAAENDLVTALERITDTDGPSLSSFLRRRATEEQFREYLTLRSVYHLKETDAHTWLFPRITGAAKTALAELAYDEFGAGRPEDLHQRLYAEALTAAGLNAEYGHYLNQAPEHVLAVNNLMSLFGLHRRLRGACAGHFAAFEMTSSIPCRKIMQGGERLGFAEPVLRYFSEHVEADAVHEQIAARDLCGSMVAEDPALRADVLFGAAACMLLDADSAAATLADWEANDSGLRTAAPRTAAA